MLKSGLVARIAAKNNHLSAKDIENLVDAIFNGISQALHEGNRVELRGFGTFSVRRREEHTGRNPRTGAQVRISRKIIPHFKNGKNMFERINKSLV